MCLAIPGKILETDGTEAVIDYGGVKRKARLDLVDAKVGDYVIVHAGYAIETLKEDEAKKTLELLEEIINESETV